MTDIADHAQLLEEQERDASLEIVRATVRDLQTAQGDATCRSCFEPIEEERLQACPGAVRCLVCQTAFEKFQRMFPRGPR